MKDVVITHLHYDHVGNFDLFPAATLHLQDLEMRYATGRYMGHECFRGAYEVEDVVGMVRRVYDGPRALPRRRRARSRPASRVHLIGGHTMGLQVGARGDAARLGGARLRREPLLRQHGAGAAVPDRLVGRPTWSTATASCARSPSRPRTSFPGHDPLVMQRYPAPSKELQGIAVRLD